jgi:hypothetical protein
MLIDNIITGIDCMLHFHTINYLGEELLQLFVKNERGGKVLICDEGKWPWCDCGPGRGEGVREREGVRGGLGRVIHVSVLPQLSIQEIGISVSTDQASWARQPSFGCPKRINSGVAILREH